MNITTDKKWLDELTLELRLRDVSGDRIGDTLATVKEFLADSGERAQDAFGTPGEYAASLNLPGDPAATQITKFVARSAIGLVAFLAFTQATWPWAARETLDVGVVQLVWLAVPALAVICLPLYFDALIRRLWIFIVAAFVCAAAGVLAAVSAPQTSSSAWLSLDPLLVLTVTGVIMIAISVINTVTAMKDDDDDPIREPLGDPAVTRRQAAISRLMSIIGAWLFPVVSLVFLGIALLSA